MKALIEGDTMTNGARKIEKRRVEREIRHRGETLLKYGLEFPYVTDDTRANGLYSGWAAATERRIRTECLAPARRQLMALLRRGEFAPLTAEASCQVMYNLGGVTSVFDDIYIDKRREGTRLLRTSLTIGSGSEPLPLGALFRRGAAWRHRLLDEVCGQIRQARSGGSLYFLDAEDRAGKNIGSAGYYLADDGLVLYFPAEVIAGSGMGIPSFMVSYEKLGEMLRLKL